jgi:DNA replication protein DnaC
MISEDGLVILPDEDYDEHTRNEVRDTVLRDAQDRIPERYLLAGEPVEHILTWVKQLIKLADERRGRRQPVIRRGPSRILIGDVGAGKTHAAYSALWTLLASGAHCTWEFTTMANAYAAMRPRNGVDTEAAFWKLARTGLLVLDDVGAAKSSEWTEEILYRLINERYERFAPTLITTNLIALLPAVGDRVASRLAEMGTQIAIPGTDRRRRRTR